MVIVIVFSFDSAVLLLLYPVGAYNVDILRGGTFLRLRNLFCAEKDEFFAAYVHVEYVCSFVGKFTYLLAAFGHQSIGRSHGSFVI